MSGGPRRQTGRERPSTGPAAGPPGTEVLVVEDSATQAEELRQLLEDHGYAVTVAGDGHTALAAARTRRPALVVSDIVMPETDGYALCRAFKADEGLKDVPVILLTVLSTPHDILKGLECGADNFVTKPYRAENLLSLIGYVLANRELRRGGRTQMGVEIVFGGQKYFITSERQQILDLLLSTYETAIERNDDLARVQKELQALNEQLEERVRQRTAELTGEIAERRRAELLQLACLDPKAALVEAFDEDRAFGRLIALAAPPGAALLVLTRSEDLLAGLAAGHRHDL